MANKDYMTGADVYRRKCVVTTIVVAIIALLFVVLSYFIIVAGVNEQYDEIQTKVNTLKNQIEVQQSIAPETRVSSTTAVLQTATGMDFDRKSEDDEKMEELLKEAMSWSSGDEYMMIRDDLIARYDLDSRSQFLTVFMPPLTVARDSAGNTYNRIDMYGLNAEFEGLGTYVTKIAADKYTYFGFVTWSTVSNRGSEGTHFDVVEYTIDGDGNISGLTAYALGARQ